MKAFTKGCAVSIKGWGKFYEGRLWFDAIKKVGENLCKGDLMFDYLDSYSFLIINEDGHYKYTNSDSGYNLLTPTDILGEHLVKAIEEGYKPYFKDDERPEGLIEVVLRNGVKPKPALSCDLIWINGYIEHDIIAYKPIEYPSIESKTLSEKVGPSMFDMSVKDFEIAKSCKQNLELLLAKEENKPYIEGLVRELGL